jgi:hypothetical protein
MPSKIQASDAKHRTSDKTADDNALTRAVAHAQERGAA